MRVVRCPLRLSIGGGGTDLPAYCREKGGDLIFSAIDKYVYVIAEQRLKDSHCISVEESFEVVNSLSESSNKYIKALSKDLDLNGTGLEIKSASTVPSGTGLGSSGAFTVCLIKSLESYYQSSFSDEELAEKAFNIENGVLNKKCGKQDHYSAAYGGFKRLRISKEEHVRVQSLDISPSDMKKLEESLLLFYTRETRSSDKILTHQQKQINSKEAKMDKMDKIKEIGAEIRDSLENGRIDEYGELLDKHWSIKKKFSQKMTNPMIDRMYSTAKEQGALGGKIVGAGGGGFLMLYAKKNDQEQIKQELEQIGAKNMEFKFSKKGFEVIYDDNSP